MDAPFSKNKKSSHFLHQPITPQANRTKIKPRSNQAIDPTAIGWKPNNSEVNARKNEAFGRKKRSKIEMLPWEHRTWLDKKIRFSGLGYKAISDVFNLRFDDKITRHMVRHRAFSLFESDKKRKKISILERIELLWVRVLEAIELSLDQEKLPPASQVQLALRLMQLQRHFQDESDEKDDKEAWEDLSHFSQCFESLIKEEESSLSSHPKSNATYSEAHERKARKKKAQLSDSSDGLDERLSDELSDELSDKPSASSDETKSETKS